MAASARRRRGWQRSSRGPLRRVRLPGHERSRHCPCHVQVTRSRPAGRRRGCRDEPERGRLGDRQAQALPSIQRDLHIATMTLQWLVSAYAVAFGGFLLLGGRLADACGRARLYRIGLVVFVAASISGGRAVEPGLLIASRGVQGIGAALLAHAGLSCWSPAGQRAADRHSGSAAGLRASPSCLRGWSPAYGSAASGPRRPCSWAVGFALAACWPPGWCRPGRRTPTCRSRVICSVITPAGSPDHGLFPGAVPRRRGGGVLTRPSRMGSCPSGSAVPVRRSFCPNGSWFPGPYMYKLPLTA